jgi:hypothetical protein
MERIVRRKALCLSLALTALFAVRAAAQDQSRVWTSAASAGTADEQDAGKLVLDGSRVTLSPALQPEAAAVIRYNVVAVDGLFAGLTPTSWPALIVQYRDAGGRERVRACLKEYDLGTGTTRTVIEFDSDLYPQLPTYQSQSIGDCGEFTAFEFAASPAGKAYFVEVELVRSHRGGGPGLAAVALSRYGVCEGIVSSR